MTTEEAIKTIWDYMHLNHELTKADVIMVLGSTDITPATRAAELWLQGLAPVLVCSGSGTRHAGNPAWDNKFAGSTEADVYAGMIKDLGVPEEAILIENQSQNTGENFQFTKRLLQEKGIEAKKIIVVQKPTVERRIYATAKVWLPDTEVLVTSPHVSLEEYAHLRKEDKDHWIHGMVGDMQRIKEYPKQGFQIEQEIPAEVWEAYEFLVEAGFAKYLIK